VSNFYSYNGISFLGALTLIFITLKLCKVITWNWWQVLTPIWIPIVIFLSVLIIIGIILFFMLIINKMWA